MLSEQIVGDSPNSDKSKKYDRQLRLWGDHGQQLIESAHVCIINATATNTEILKNLILPGIGSFTIIDKEKVTGENIGCNFFLDKNSLHKSRAEVTCELLSELNEDACGDIVEEDVSHILNTNPDYFNAFNLVITSTLPEKVLLRLASTLWDLKIPLMVCSSFGMIGYMRIAFHQCTVVESHPDNTIEDLRLLCPFPALKKFCDNLDLDSMSKKDHSHTPWLVIVYKYLQKWREEHDGKHPQNFKEMKQLKQMISEGRRIADSGVTEPEENFDEAMQHLNTAISSTNVPSNVQEVFQHSNCKNLTRDSKPFWILAKALQQFVEQGNGSLPLRGSIPDMTSDSERYIQLQNVYHEKASEDMATLTNHLHTILQSTGRLQDDLSDNDIKMFCKNASFLKVIDGSSLDSEYNVQASGLQDIVMQLEDTDSEAIHYVMLRAIQRFYAEYERYPGTYDDSSEADIPKLKTCVNKLMQEWGMNVSIKDDYIIEYCRCGGAEFHSVAAYMGGCAAQEAIKIITNQFIPINNTFIYNAVKQTSAVFTL